MQQVLIDCGSNIGQGYEKLSKRLNIDLLWTVYMFEPNEVCVDVLKRRYLDINIINKAVWDSNTKRKLTVQYQYIGDDFQSDIYPVCNGWLGGFSNVLDNFVKPKHIKKEDLKVNGYVDCIDLSEFISDFKGSEVYLKLDIEGAEFCVLDKMIKDGTILLVNTIFIEWHEEMVGGKVNRERYIEFFNKAGIKYFEWE
jgi:FkbM family methyltransferase